MSYVLLDIENDHYLTGSLPLTLKSKLTWIGFISFFLLIFFVYKAFLLVF